MTKSSNLHTGTDMHYSFNMSFLVVINPPPSISRYICNLLLGCAMILLNWQRHTLPPGSYLWSHNPQQQSLTTATTILSYWTRFEPSTNILLTTIRLGLWLDNNRYLVSGANWNNLVSEIVHCSGPIMCLSNLPCDTCFMSQNLF